jgi:hypothetical protein
MVVYAGSKLEVRMSDFRECIPVYRRPVVDRAHRSGFKIESPQFQSE